MSLKSVTTTALEVDNSADTSATMTASDVDESVQEKVMSHSEVDDPVQDSATQITLVGDSSCMRVNVTSHSNNDYMQIDDSLQVNQTVEVDRVTELNMGNSTQAQEEYNVQQPDYGPVTFSKYKEEMESILKEKLSDLEKVDAPLESFLKMFEKERVLVETSMIESLLIGPCRQVNCSARQIVTEKKIDGCVLSLVYKCEKGHGGVWYSSSLICQKRNQNVFVTPTLVSAAVLISGNNFDKLSLFAKCLNWNFVSQTHFTRTQSLYAIPSIKDFWLRMKTMLWEVFKNESLVLSGDGRMDSPGFSAKYCLYVMMHTFLNVILDVEVVDKREASGTSTLMEKIGCKRILERANSVLNISELVTDASSTIIKMLKELKGNYITVYLRGTSERLHEYGLSYNSD